jgi:hypothetical protein
VPGVLYSTQLARFSDLANLRRNHNFCIEPQAHLVISPGAFVERIMKPDDASCGAAGAQNSMETDEVIHAFSNALISDETVP